MKILFFIQALIYGAFSFNLTEITLPPLGEKDLLSEDTFGFESEKDIDKYHDTTLKYSISAVNSHDEEIIANIFEKISKYTCIKFQKVNYSEGVYKSLDYQSPNMDRYSIQRMENYKILDQIIHFDLKRPLDKSIYYDIGDMLHLIPEHLRYDRNKYVKIYSENADNYTEMHMEPFPKEPIEVNTSYDYGSGMHYHRTRYSINEKNTIEPLDKNYLNTIGQNNGFSFNDYKRMNILNCFNKCDNFVGPCLRNGYNNPKHCKGCICPPHYTGQYCDEYRVTRYPCGKTLFMATDSPQYIVRKGRGDCFYYISTDYMHAIEIKLESANLYDNGNHCPNKKGLEIRYRKDPSVMGAMFCGEVKKKKMLSEGNEVSIDFRSDNDKYWFMLSFKRVPANVTDEC